MHRRVSECILCVSQRVIPFSAGRIHRAARVAGEVRVRFSLKSETDRAPRMGARSLRLGDVALTSGERNRPTILHSWRIGADEKRRFRVSRRAQLPASLHDHEIDGKRPNFALFCRGERSKAHVSRGAVWIAPPVQFLLVRIHSGDRILTILKPDRSR
jgi:hypothetical protein